MVWFDDADPVSGLPRTVGFRVKNYFKSSRAPLRSEFVPGRQGQGKGVYVQVKDTFDANRNPLKDWIHQHFIEIGTEIYGNWKIDVCNILRASLKLTPDEPTLFYNPKTDPGCLMEADLGRLGGSTGDKVPWITANVLAGVDKAGLLAVLNNPQFTMTELEASANLDCTLSVAKNEGGIYFRRYVESKSIPGQSKKPLSLYVGQTVDFYGRYMAWTTAGHEDLKEKSESVEMRALCRLELLFYKEHKFTIEQLFTSLLQTYKQELPDGTADLRDVQSIFNTKNCSDMDKIASASAHDSKWTGALQRKSFWNSSFSTCAGPNHPARIPRVYPRSRKARQVDPDLELHPRSTEEDDDHECRD
ncbi:hypothetical protein G6011_10876 [Alternaria panax]|uniref:Uncharacterized protein n=1 Tax=Alternaria panax TaxID=48097 RepID=A0AAD4NQV0_9PLEO|nr:hypothetical protein G6011_10876 [Alternaria panax]